MNWSDEETISFIEMYRDRSFLWDNTDPQYRNRNKRHYGLMEIAVFFGIEKYEVEKKIKNMQSQFARERKKESESRKNVSAAEEAYTSKWFAYKSMMFLPEKNKPKNTQVTEGSLDKEDEEKRDENNCKVNFEVETSNVEDNDATTSTPHKKIFTSPKKPMKKRKVNSTSDVPIIDEVLKNLLRSIQSKKKVKDEYTLFGEQVAIKLRNITSPQARFAAQQIINKTLFEAEMGMTGYLYNSQPIFHEPTSPTMYPSPNQNYQSQQSTQPPTLFSPSSSYSAQSPASVQSESDNPDNF